LFSGFTVPFLPRVSPRPDAQGRANAAERKEARESPVEIRFSDSDSGSEPQ